ncbi:MAG: hypothetical protein A2919_01740 [Candidatus Spechtbacteria bacterium RIFCSPLOWO2_01_FULL_43_12]|uniref:Antitoxin n=1 Tax=Candidatus Spechtbacteria bacterium RIFCSPLOWO2_01_FULL_43_12 TaxID=1802162 RepID=A0A1G2HDN7_9BACT|nr:MAG: hypothetical protein A2919_01740 [Candidatus Spechtbacteria bacterium RIFCSPLOWO2_01_FULL_43_12]
MWESIKQLLKTDKDKAVLMENGQPKYVILSVGEYLKLNSELSAQDPQPAESLPARRSLDEGEAQTDNNTRQPSLAQETYPGSPEEFNFMDAASDELLDLSEIETYTADIAENIADEPKEIDLDDLPV